MRRRVRVTLETGDRHLGGVAVNLSEGGLAVMMDASLRTGTRVVVTALLPAGGRASFDAVVRHAQRTGEGVRIGLELAEPAPAPYRRFVGDELAMLMARSGAGGTVPEPRAGRRGIPSPPAMRAARAVAPPAPPAPTPRRRSPAAATPIARIKRRTTPRGLRPKTPSRGGAPAAGHLAKLEKGLPGIATMRLPASEDVDAIAAATVIREAIANALDGLLPDGARIAIVSVDVALEDEAAGEGNASLAAAVRLATLDRAASTASFDAEVSRRGHTVARGRVTVRVTP